MPLSDIIDQLQPEVRPVDMLFDQQTAGRVLSAERAVEAARSRLEQAEKSESGMVRPAVTAAKQELDDATDRLAEVQKQAQTRRVTLWLRELGAARWRELMWLCPPTDQQRERLGQKLDHNPELFGIVALAFSLVDVEQDDDGTVTVVGPAVDRDELDTLDRALKKAAGDPDRAEKAVDANLPDALVKLHERMRHGGWEKLTNVLYTLNLEVSQVPLSLTGSNRTGSS